MVTTCASRVHDCNIKEDAINIKFVSEAESLVHLHESFVKNYKQKFLEFSDFP